MNCSWCNVSFSENGTISRKINDEEYCLDCLHRLACIGKEIQEKRNILYLLALKSMESNQA